MEEESYREQQKRDLYGRGSGALCCFLLVFLLVAAVAVAGLVLSILNFGRDSGPKVDITDHRYGLDYREQEEGDRDDKEDGDDDYMKEEYVPGPYNRDEIWLIQFDVDDSRLEYIDPIVGRIKGYNVDVVNAVCRKANKNCQIVYDSYSRCWSGGYGGEGLMARWYHACSGWRVTNDRLFTYKFTDPFQKSVPAYLVTRRGSSTQFDWRDLTGKKIGFLEGWFTDAGCLNRQDGIRGLPLSKEQIIVYPTATAIESALVNEEIDVLFIAAGLELLTRQAIASDEIQCLVEGAGLMMRKDTHLDKWWNPAWKALLASDEYQDICDDLERVHGHKAGLSKDLLCRDKYEDLRWYRHRR